MIHTAFNVRAIRPFSRVITASEIKNLSEVWNFFNRRIAFFPIGYGTYFLYSHFISLSQLSYIFSLRTACVRDESKAATEISIGDTAPQNSNRKTAFTDYRDGGKSCALTACP
jgi:hypothetical protein